MIGRSCLFEGSFFFAKMQKTVCSALVDFSSLCDMMKEEKDKENVMKLRFQQRMFSWFCSYDIYNEAGQTVYEVKGQLSWGHCLKIFDPNGNEIGTVKQCVLTFLPKFELYLGERYLGCISKEWTLFRPSYHIDCNGWRMEGNWMEWDYRVLDRTGNLVATISKELGHWTDTYVIDVPNSQNALCALMLVLAIDAEKCSRSH